MNDDEKPGHSELAVRLRRLRQEAKLSGADLAAAAGMSQSKISRIERGRATPTEHEVQAIASALHIDMNTTHELKSHVRALNQFEASFDTHNHSVETLQQEVYGVERLARQIDKFVSQIVPGLLQTKEYAEAVFRSLPEFGVSDFDDFVIRSVVLRMQRQAEIYDMRKTFRILMTDVSLNVHFGSTQVMKDQLKALLDLTRPNVELRILDTSQPLPYGHTHIFDIFDRRLALAESLFTMQWIHDPRQVELLSSTFDRMWDVADSGVNARCHIERALERFSAVDDTSVVPFAELDVRTRSHKV